MSRDGGHMLMGGHLLSRDGGHVLGGHVLSREDGHLLNGGHVLIGARNVRQPNKVMEESLTIVLSKQTRCTLLIKVDYLC